MNSNSGTVALYRPKSNVTNSLSTSEFLNIYYLKRNMTIDY